jgi:phosphopantothenoylcysteine synthetase/decarboxylase
MKKKNCDMMVVNRAETSLEGDTSIARILFPGKPAEACGLQSKRELAAHIINRIAEQMGSAHG